MATTLATVSLPLLKGDVGGSGDHGNNPGDSLPTPPQGNVGGSGSLGGSAGDVGEGGSTEM